jgi:hypothetical protein
MSHLHHTPLSCHPTSHHPTVLAIAFLEKGSNSGVSSQRAYDRVGAAQPSQVARSSWAPGGGGKAVAAPASVRESAQRVFVNYVRAAVEAAAAEALDDEQYDDTTGSTTAVKRDARLAGVAVRIGLSVCVDLSSALCHAVAMLTQMVGTRRSWHVDSGGQ